MTSWQDAVAHGLSQRAALGQSPHSLNSSPYCKARARLALARSGGQENRGTAPFMYEWLEDRRAGSHRSD